MSKPTIALVTAAAARDVDEDLPPLESALRDAGADVTIAEWDRPRDWSRFDIALLRSTWDYPQRLGPEHELTPLPGLYGIIGRVSG